ncbi:calmodulin-binding transcription activator 5-like [Papaver somniferum]|uniref:calmodulin-binding transcription activator 5-like n=1 Tax=Papaver somniferum TaxID=3469 RepID=UPI000E704362|nr:calmodulin-binding transcription activator 5-like [Papaver somniferum]
MEGVDGMSIGEEDREAMTAVDAEEMQIYKNIQGLKPCGDVPKIIDITEAHSITDDERHSLYKSLGFTTTHKQIFSITGITNNTAISTLGREIAITGRFLDEQPDIDWKKTPFFFIFGNRSHRAVCLGEWVSSCIPMFHLPGTVNFWLSLDGTTPISQILKFDFLSTSTNQELFSTYSGFRQQLCLAHLLYSKTKRMTDLSGISNFSEAKIMHDLILSYCERNSTTFIRSIQNPFGRGENLYLEILLETMLMEWIYKRLEEGCPTETLNFQGLGVIHMLAILSYRSLIRMYCELGKGKLSLDFADLTGWTALHWAAFFNRNQTAQLLVGMGANPTLVTGRTIQFRNGLTVAEVALKNGHHKLASHLGKITEEYLHRINAAALEASSSQVQLDTENHTEMGGNCKSGKKRFRDDSEYGQAVKIQAAFRGFRIRKHYAGNQSKEVTPGEAS